MTAACLVQLKFNQTSNTKHMTLVYIYGLHGISAGKFLTGANIYILVGLKNGALDTLNISTLIYLFLNIRGLFPL